MPPTAATTRTPLRAPRREAPIGGTPLQGIWRRFRHDPLNLLTHAAREHGDVVQFVTGAIRLYLVVHPDHVQHVLVDHRRNYSKRTRGYDALRAYLGNGLVTSEGDFWQRQRRIAQPAFHRQRIATFADTMAALSSELADRWAADHALGRTIDAHADMTALTLRIVARTLLSSDVSDDNHEIGEAVERMNGMARDVMTNPLYPPMWVPTPKNLAFRRLGQRIDRVINGIIEERRRTGEDKGDLLSMLMYATDDETGERMTDAQLRDEIMTMFLAGHETTANALSWALYLLSTHPTVRRQMQAELDAVLGGRTPTFDDLPSLPYTHCVVQETMRLYPPAWSIGRRCEAEDTLGGYRIARDSLVILSPWVTHRHPRFWPNPEGFDPERFAAGADKRPRYAYFPFGGGPRQCIGNNFALMEADLVLATLVQRFDADLVPGSPVTPAAYITLRPSHGLPMVLRRRSPA